MAGGDKQKALRPVDLFRNLFQETITSCFGNLAGQTCDGSGYDPLNRTTFKSFSDGWGFRRRRTLIPKGTRTAFITG